MGALPRPVTPGPWRTVGERERGGLGIETVDTDPVRGSAIIYAHGSYMPPLKKDAAAIAALPERIAREDRVRELCKGAILARPPGAMSPADAIRTIKWDAEALMAQRVLALLDGEEGA